MLISPYRMQPGLGGRPRCQHLGKWLLCLILFLAARVAQAADPPSSSPPEIEPPPAPLIDEAPAAPVQVVPPAAPPIKDNVPIQNIESLDLKDLLNEPVVTAGGGVEEERSLASANVYTISREEIAAHGWRSLTELLAIVPGLSLGFAGLLVGDVVLEVLRLGPVHRLVHGGEHLVASCIRASYPALNQHRSQHQPNTHRRLHRETSAWSWHSQDHNQTEHIASTATREFP